MNNLNLLSKSSSEVTPVDIVKTFKYIPYALVPKLNRRALKAGKNNLSDEGLDVVAKGKLNLR